MTKILRQTGMYALVLLVGMFTMMAVATPVSAQDDSCYPVPPGGCPDVAPECADVVAAIVAGDPSDETLAEMDANGDGVLDEQDLPASCTCEELIAAIAAGEIDPANLPPDALADCGCSEILDAIAAGTLDASNLPEGAAEALAQCGCSEILDAIAAGTLDADNLPAAAAEALAQCGCDELVAAIVAGTVDPMNLPGDLGDLLATCCEALADAVVAGDIDPADLPEGLLEDCGCDTVQTLIDAGVLDADALPEECEDGPSVAVSPDNTLADTGIDAEGMGAMTLGALLAGGLFLLLSRRRTAE